MSDGYVNKIPLAASSPNFADSVRESIEGFPALQRYNLPISLDEGKSTDKITKTNDNRTSQVGAFQDSVLTPVSLRDSVYSYNAAGKENDSVSTVSQNEKKKKKQKSKKKKTQQSKGDISISKTGEMKLKNTSQIGILQDANPHRHRER